MRVRFPLAAKIAGWFLLNLLLLVAGLALFFRAQFGVQFDALLTGAAGPQLQTAAELIHADMRGRPREDWDAVLNRYDAAYGVEFGLFGNDGSRLAGVIAELPPEVREKLGGPPGRGGSQPRREGGPRGGERPPRGGGPREGEGPPRPGVAFPKTLLRAGEPRDYWAIVRLPPLLPPGPASLIVRSPSLSGGGLFFEIGPWLTAGLGAILFSVLLWMPFVVGLTRGVRRVTQATARVAEGDFSVQVPDQRGDELGTLATSVNRMAGRLEVLVNGQKRFLADVAHELCSPIARMQAALGILENSTSEPKQSRYVASVGSELQEMSGLVNELLSFSKASLRREIALQPVALATLVQRVVEREGEGAEIDIEVPDALTALGEPELLSRALGNLIRNARRYASGSGPITVSAETRGELVVLTVADRGPGVPPEALPRLFDAFYRPDAARTRESGGAGLGLAIVKTCVEACGGTVSAANRPSGGLQVALHLQQ